MAVVVWVTAAEGLEVGGRRVGSWRHGWNDNGSNGREWRGRRWWGEWRWIGCMLEWEEVRDEVGRMRWKQSNEDRHAKTNAPL